MLMENMIAYGIVIIAAIYVFKIVLGIFKKSPVCGCGCTSCGAASDCEMKPSQHRQNDPSETREKESRIWPKGGKLIEKGKQKLS